MSFKQIIMTKADIVLNISDDLGLDRADVQATVEKFHERNKKFIRKRGKRLLKRVW